MKAVKLYELTEQARVLDAWLDEEADAIAAAEGEIPEHLVALLDGLEADFTAKVDSIARVVRSLEESAALAKAEKDRLAKREKAFTARAEWLRRYLAAAMEATNRDTIKTPVATITLQKARAKFSLVAGQTLEGLRSVFPNLVTVTPVPARENLALDVDAVSAYLNDGPVTPPDAPAVAAFVERRLVRTLSIR